MLDVEVGDAVSLNVNKVSIHFRRQPLPTVGFEMLLLTRLTLIAGSILIFGFAAVILLQIIMGRIPLDGLLDSKDDSGRAAFSPARMQLLIFTLVVAAQYLHAVFVNPRQDSLPSLPPGVIAALGGSQAVYLGGKAFTAFIQPLLKKLERGGFP